MSQSVSIGARFGRLTIVEAIPRASKAERQQFRCVCDCGGEKVSVSQPLRLGRVQSCGCLRNLKVLPVKTFPDKICVICGSSWTPKTWAQSERNCTCSQACKVKHISARRRRPLDELKAELEEKSTLQPSGCITWNGRIYRGGYGRTCVHGRLQMVHRVAYEIAKGPIEPGLCIDHLCRVRSCINPDHLEAVTHQENVRRGARATQTHCHRGHEFTLENTRHLSSGGRVCRACCKIRRAARRARGARP